MAQCVVDAEPNTIAFWLTDDDTNSDRVADEHTVSVSNANDDADGHLKPHTDVVCIII